MEDFLKMVQTSTFAIFKIRTPLSTASSSPSSSPLQQQQKQQHESIGLYLLALVPNDDTLYSLSSWIPNKSNTNNNNNNNNSAQSKSADEAFSSLYNELNNISNFTIPIV
jgi:hypothetical protein